MLKKSLYFVFFCCIAFASDPITIYSLFKQQVGIRSFTNLSFLSSGNPNVYTSYPTLTINGNPVVWDDTKQILLNQTFIYAMSPKLDLTSSSLNFNFIRMPTCY